MAAMLAAGVYGVAAQGAQAQTYCVNVASSTTLACDVSQAVVGSLGDQLQSALTASANHPGDDTVQVGAGTYTRSGGFTSTDADRLAVNGAGRGATTLTDSNASANETTFTGTGTVALKDLRIVGPMGSATIALKLTGNGSSLTAGDLIGPNGATGAVAGSSQGAYVSGATLTDTTVAGFDIAIVVSNSAPGAFHLDTSTVSGQSNGVFNFADTATINRSTVTSPAQAVTGGNGGLTVTNSLLVGTGPGGTAAEAECFPSGSAVFIRGSTLVGGAAAYCTQSGGLTSIDISRSILVPGASIVQYQSAGGVARASIESSDWDGSHSGTIQDNGGNITADPQFVSATDFELKATSPAIDAVGTVDYELGPLDLLGHPRDVGRTVNSVPRPDMGAYEFQSEPAVIPTPMALPSPLPAPQKPTLTPTYTGPAVMGGTLSVDATGHLSVTVACPAAAVLSCTVTVTITRTTGSGKKKKSTTLAVGTSTPLAGKSAAVPLKLTKAGRKLVTKSGLKVSLVTTSTDARATPVKVTTTTVAKLKPAGPKARHKP